MATYVGEPLATIYGELKKYRYAAIAVLLIAIALLAFGVHWKAVLFFPPLFIIAAVSSYYRRFARVPPAFELVTITTVAVGMTHGPLAGAVFGAAAGLAAEIVSSGIDAFVVSYVPGRIVMGAAAGFFPNADVLVLGMILVVVYNVIAQSLYLLQGDPESRLKTAVFVFFNLGINFILFSAAGPFLLALLG